MKSRAHTQTNFTNEQQRDYERGELNVFGLFAQLGAVQPVSLRRKPRVET